MSQLPTPNKPLPTIPRPSTSTLSLSPVANSDPEDENDLAPIPSADSSNQLCATVTSDTTKRDYALLELLESERTYASDLILIRDYQIPLASGRLSSISSIWPASDSETTIPRYPGLATSDFHTIPLGSSVAVSRPLTTASEASAMSLDSIFTLRPMKTKDINVVFGNIEELAAFSEKFLYQLESALGELIEGNEGDDYLGRFFLDFIPQMEPLYRTYIMNQSHALEHYHRLSKTFQFDVYFPQSQILAHKSSNAWDLPSLLIKPVQRLLHYPSLLAAIVATTPDSHGDKANLVAAHARMEELARHLNARWKQQKVVQDVLAGVCLSDVPHVGHEVAKVKKNLKEGLKVGLAGSVSLGRIMKPRLVMVNAKEGTDVEVVKAMGEKLRSYERFMIQLAQEMSGWADAMCNLVGALNGWAQSFGRVIWMDTWEECSDVFEAFLALIGGQLVAASHELRTEIGEDVLWVIDSLRGTMVAPIRLLESMQTLEQLHYSPLNTNLTASESYVAVRAQLLEELPTFLTLLDKGIAACILRFSRIQRRFYGKAHVRWAELGDRFEADGQANQGAAETLRTWLDRYSAAEAQVTSLSIARRFGERPMPAKLRVESGEYRTDGGLQAASSVPLASILAVLEQSRGRSTRAIRLPAAPYVYPASKAARPRGIHSMDSIQSEVSLMSEVERPQSSWRQLTDEASDVLRSQVGVVSVEEVAQSQPRHVHFVDVPEVIPPSVIDSEEGSASDRDDPDHVAIPYWDAGKLAPWKPDARELGVSMAISPYVKREAAFGTRRVLYQPPSQAPYAASLWTAYSRESSANAKFGTRLVNGLSTGPSAPYPAGRRTTNTSRESAAIAKFGTRLIRDSPHSALRPASRGTAAAHVNRKGIPHSHEGRFGGITTGTTQEGVPLARARATANKDSGDTSDPDSEDSGIGFYRMICSQDSALRPLVS